VLHALARDPSQRYSSAAELEADLAGGADRVRWQAPIEANQRSHDAGGTVRAQTPSRPYTTPRAAMPTALSDSVDPNFMLWERR